MLPHPTLSYLAASRSISELLSRALSPGSVVNSVRALPRLGPSIMDKKERKNPREKFGHKKENKNGGKEKKKRDREVEKKEKKE